MPESKSNGVSGGNWIKLHRKLNHSAIASDPTAVGIWALLLLSAQWETKVFNGQIVERGQLVLSVEKTAKQWSMGRKRLSQYLSIFGKLGMIEIVKADRKGTQINICNYSVYQDCPVTEPGNGTLTTAKATGKRTSYKKVKKEEEGEEFIAPPDGGSLFPEDQKEIFKEKLKQPKRDKARPADVAEVAAYCRERSNGIDAEQFWNHYEANGWKRGKNAIKDWRACVRTWERNNRSNTNGQKQTEIIPFDFSVLEGDE